MASRLETPNLPHLAERTTALVGRSVRSMKEGIKDALLGLETTHPTTLQMSGADLSLLPMKNPWFQTIAGLGDEEGRKFVQLADRPNASIQATHQSPSRGVGAYLNGSGNVPNAASDLLINSRMQQELGWKPPMLEVLHDNEVVMQIGPHENQLLGRLASARLQKGQQKLANADASKLFAAALGGSLAAGALMEQIGDQGVPQAVLRGILKGVAGVGYDLALVGSGTMNSAKGSNMIEKIGSIMNTMSVAEKWGRGSLALTTMVAAIVSEVLRDDPMLRGAYVYTPTLSGLMQNAMTAQKRGWAEVVHDPKWVGPTGSCVLLGSAGTVGATIVDDPQMRLGIELVSSGGTGDVVVSAAIAALQIAMEGQTLKQVLQARSEEFVGKHWGEKGFGQGGTIFSRFMPAQNAYSI